MDKFRVVTVPRQGKKDRYRVQIRTLTLSPWWSSKPPEVKWSSIDAYGFPWFTSMYGPTRPPLKLFKTDEKARKWVSEHVEYLGKTPRVTYRAEA